MMRRRIDLGRALAGAIGFLVTVGAAGACGTTTSNSSGETHFLSYCEKECGTGFECLCGVCTESCSSDAACNDAGPGATCSNVLGGTCGGSESVCDVACETDADCEGLGAEHRCRQGSCRAGSLPQPSFECPDDCSVLHGYPEDRIRGCVDLDATVPGDDGPGVPVACTCEEPRDTMQCRVRESDKTLWLLPANELRDAQAWSECNGNQQARTRVSCDFNHCAPDARPPSTCNIEDTCSALDCGRSQYGEDGCLRTSCEDDGDCDDDQYCGTLFANLLESFIGREGCGSGGGGGLFPEQFCRALDDTGPLCDGTDAVRLFANSDGGGPLSESFAFTNPYGHVFMMVTGQCEVYAGPGENGSIRVASLSSEAAQELEAAIGWDSLPEWNGFRDSSTCFDGGVSSLQTWTASAACVCGLCGANAPDGLEQALGEGITRATEFSTSGDALDGDVRVVSVPVEPGGEPPPEDWVTWPLQQDLAEFAIEPLSFEAESGLIVDDPDDAQALRELRNSYDLGDYFPLTAQGSDGTVYSFWVRDELPPALADSLAALRARH